MKLLQVQASSSQDAATSALSQAESAKAEAQRKSTEAQSAQAEAEKQKGIATQKSQAAAQSEQQKAAVSSKLSTCQYYLNLAAQLTSLLSQQKVLYKAANSYVAKTVSDVLYGDYTAAKDDIDQAGYYLSAAASMDNQVNALLNQFQ